MRLFLCWKTRADNVYENEVYQRTRRKLVRPDARRLSGDDIFLEVSRQSRSSRGRRNFIARFEMI